MASKAVSMVIEAEENANKLLENAHASARSVIEDGRARAERVRAEIIEQANAYSEQINEQISERYEYAAHDARKRAGSEAERIKTAYAENKERVLAAVTQALFSEQQ